MVKELKNVNRGDIIEIEYKNQIRNEVGKVVGYVYAKGDLTLQLINTHPKDYLEHRTISTYDLERIIDYRILKKEI